MGVNAFWRGIAVKVTELTFGSPLGAAVKAPLDQYMPSCGRVARYAVSSTAFTFGGAPSELSLSNTALCVQSVMTLSSGSRWLGSKEHRRNNSVQDNTTVPDFSFLRPLSTD